MDENDRVLKSKKLLVLAKFSAQLGIRSLVLPSRL